MPHFLTNIFFQENLADKMDRKLNGVRAYEKTDGGRFFEIFQIS